MIKELEKEGLLLTKPTSYGKEVSVNPDEKERIMHYIEVFLDKD